MALRLELFVADVARSAAFYTDVLGFAREAASGGYIALRSGGVTLGIGRIDDLPASHPLRARPGERVGLGVEIVIEVADVDAAHRAVTDAGWPLLLPLAERPWGLRDFRFSDPDGYYIRVTSLPTHR